MFVNIQKAIELTGLSRSTIQRHIKQGKLSKTDKGIDTSELIRCYGDLKPVSDSGMVKHSDSALSERESFLMRQIDLLTKQLELANEREHQAIEREKRLMALIEVKTGSFFSGLFKR